MTTAEQAWDVYNIEGSLAPFLVEPPWYVAVPCLINIFDFWRECHHEEVSVGEWNPDWDRAHELWLDIERCCHQAEAMMSMQPDFARCLAIYTTHIKNMATLLAELRGAMLKCGCNFPEFQRAVPA